MTGGLNPTLRAVSDAVLAVAAGLSVDEVLQRLVDSARELAGARYAALGLPDGEGGFRRFLTSGMSDRLIASLGPLPRQHGVLGAMLDADTPYRTRDIHEHPRFRGWWPAAHPDMRSFLGVPIVSPTGVIGAFYLTEKLDADDFTDDDQELIGLLAAHAAIAIANARLHEQTRELSIVAERNRLALDLHDAVSQKLFGLVLDAEAAATLLERDPDSGARPGREAPVARARGARGAPLARLRAPPTRARAGRPRRRAPQARRAAAPARAARAGARPRRRNRRSDPARDREVLRIAQEALQNAIKHAGASRIGVRLDAEDGRLVLEVEDDGVGFDPDGRETRARSLGLTSMQERAERLGGRLAISSAPGRGTTVRLELDDG